MNSLRATWTLEKPSLHEVQSNYTVEYYLPLTKKRGRLKGRYPLIEARRIAKAMNELYSNATYMVGRI